MGRKHNRKFRSYMQEYLFSIECSAGIITKVIEEDGALKAVDERGKEFVINKKEWKQYLREHWE